MIPHPTHRLSPCPCGRKQSPFRKGSQHGCLFCSSAQQGAQEPRAAHHPCSHEGCGRGAHHRQHTHPTSLSARRHRRRLPRAQARGKVAAKPTPRSAAAAHAAGSITPALPRCALARAASSSPYTEPYYADIVLRLIIPQKRSMWNKNSAKFRIHKSTNYNVWQPLHHRGRTGGISILAGFCASSKLCNQISEVSGYAAALAARRASWQASQERVQAE